MISKKLVFLCLIAFNLVTAQNKDFSLSGKTSNIEDGTYLYFRDLLNGGDIDSALVKNNSFRFTTTLPEPTLYVMLFTKDKENFVELWLENNPMTFDASKTPFKEGIVTGSRNHSLFRKLHKERYSAQMTDEEKLKWEQEFIKNNSEALVSAYILYGNKMWNQIEMGVAYSNLSEEVRSSSLGQKIAGYLEKDLPELGEHYTDFSLPNYKNEITKMSDLKSEGKLTLLQFWSSTCPFSRDWNTTLAGLYHKFPSDRFEIITVSWDTNKEKWIQAIKEDKISWSQLSNLIDKNRQVFDDYGIFSISSNLLINGEGIVVGKNLKGPALEQKINEEIAN